MSRAVDYLVADLFCGAGGSSTGAKKAIEAKGGNMELVAINHWNTAIATHQANHPTARHLVEDVSLVDPEAVVEEGRLDLLMASPECKFYSRARGGKPIHDQGRMNPWAVHNWLTKLDVDAVIVENVPEFVDWGPLTPEGKPDKTRKGDHFQAWFLAIQALGYHAEWRMLNAADYGDATTRVRFFLMARKSGPVSWPEPSHAKGDTGMFPGRKPWRGAKEIIDWENPGRSLLDDPKYLKKPLSEKTRRRIARGLERFGGPLASLYIRLLDLPEHLAVNGNGHHAEPFVQANRNHNTPKSTEEPVPAITTAPGGGSFLVEPSLQSFMLGQQSAGAPRSTEDPTPTIAAAGAVSLVKPTGCPFVLSHQRNTEPKSPEQPVPTITGKGPGYIVAPSLVEYYGNSDAASVEQPLPTVTAKARHGLASPTLLHVNHAGDDRRVQSIEEPLGAVTTKRGVGLAQPVLVQTSQTGGNGIYARPPEQPLPTITTIQDLTVVTPQAEPYIVPNFGEAEGQDPRVHDINDPVPAVTSRGAGNLVSPVLEAMREQRVDPRRLVFLDGQPYLLDIRFRMLQNTELARAMGFDDEESEYEFHGNVGEVTKQIGNAVPVNLAAALVGAALGGGE